MQTNFCTLCPQCRSFHVSLRLKVDDGYYVDYKYMCNSVMRNSSAYHSLDFYNELRTSLKGYIKRLKSNNLQGENNVK